RPQGYAITFMIDLAALDIFEKLGYQEHIQRYLSSGTWTSDAFLAVVSLLEGLHVGDSGPVYAILIFIVTARIVRWLVMQDWFRDLVIMIVAKLTVAFDEDDGSIKVKPVFRWIVHLDRMQHAMALLHLLYPQSVFQLAFDLIFIVNLLLRIGDCVRHHFSSDEGLFKGKITRSLVRINFVGVTLLHLYERQDLLYYSCLLRSRAGSLLLYYACYVIFSWLIARTLNNMVQFDLNPLSGTSLLKQAELFLFQLCECLCLQDGFSMLLKFHVAMLLLFLLATWLIQINWLKWEIALRDAAIVPVNENEANVYLEDWHQMEGAQPLEVRAVALLSSRGVADLDHLVILRRPDSRFDMIWEAGQLTMRMKRGKQIHLTWKNALYIPFVQYGVIGLTTLSHDQVHELCEQKVQQYNAEEKGLNLLIRSCQEFALEIGHAIVKRNFLAECSTLKEYE
uniref:Uncharacterized protein n=1 Tax=Plectus sambesii TaxID=2011161 RepID=A0A914XNP9_9BILA